VYIRYPEAISDIINRVNTELNESILTTDVQTITRLMEEKGIIEMMHEESDHARLVLDVSGKKEEVDVVRISYPELVFEDYLLPPNLTDCELVLSANFEKLIVDNLGNVKYD
jgi:hypothetical protein